VRDHSRPLPRASARTHHAATAHAHAGTHPHAAANTTSHTHTDADADADADAHADADARTDPGPNAISDIAARACPCGRRATAADCHSTGDAAAV
jgi:hypothetical protein